MIQGDDQGPCVQLSGSPLGLRVGEGRARAHTLIGAQNAGINVINSNGIATEPRRH